MEETRLLRCASSEDGRKFVLETSTGLPPGFWDKVEGPPDPDRCWLYSGYLRNGYGSWTEGTHDRIVYYAHIRIWETAYNKLVPRGLEIDHLCRTRRCVNPNHLQLVTKAVNRQRQAEGRLDAGQHLTSKARTAWKAKAATKWKR